MRFANPIEQALLLDLSRYSLHLAVEKRILPHQLWPHIREGRLFGGPLFKRLGRVFVTLRKGGNLRGCIGSIAEELPIGPMTAENSAAAALSDPRFPPVESSELADVGLELTLLGFPRVLEKIEHIEIGKHGLLISKGHSRGLLLPQVATELGLDREAFLDLCCQKAGLESGTWRRDATLHYFEAQHFGAGSR